jgi:1-pyrroline-5-carboxylate dehydrogenase
MVFRNERTWQNAVDAGRQEEFQGAYEAAVTRVRGEFGRKYPMYIDGKAVSSRDGTFDDTSPANRRLLLGKFQKGTRADAKKAIATAKAGFAAWSGTHYLERARMMQRAADLMSERKFFLAALMTFENGKNRFEAVADVDEAVDFLRWYAEAMIANRGFEREMGQYFPNEHARSVLRPFGVWAVVSPFNFPLAIATGMTVGALITGNTAVLKPASDTPFMALRLYETLREAGVPGSALQYVTGPGSTVGQELVENEDVAGFAFTGSKAVGLGAFGRFSETHPKPMIAEMGGKNPTIVTATANLDKAVSGVLRGAFGYGGQKCSATSRVIVDRRVKRQFLARLVEETKRIKIGDPTGRDVFLGPVINEDAVRKFTLAVGIAKKVRRKLVCGGRVLRGGAFKDGLFVEPTIVDGLPPSHRINQEEWFVPILSVIECDGLDEALEIANGVEYGLTAGIFSEDPQDVARFFDRIEAGVAYANRASGSTTGAVVGVQPFGGWKASTVTNKAAGGDYYLQQFLREQSQTTYS